MICEFPGCDRKKRGKTWCQLHLRQKYEGKEMTPIAHYEKRGAHCKGQGCWRPVRAKGLCATHYIRSMRGAPDPLAPVSVRRTGFVQLHKLPGTYDASRFMVPKDLAKKIRKSASNRGMDQHAVVVDILQQYFRLKEKEHENFQKQRLRSEDYMSNPENAYDAI